MPNAMALYFVRALHPASPNMDLDLFISADSRDSAMVMWRAWAHNTVAEDYPGLLATDIKTLVAQAMRAVYRLPPPGHEVRVHTLDELQTPDQDDEEG